MNTQEAQLSKKNAERWSLKPYMEKRLVILSKDEPIQAAARAMEANGIGAILVEDKGVIIGIVTDRDLAIRGLGYESMSPRALRDLISQPLSAVDVSASLDDVLAVMSQGKVRRVPILDAQGHACGLVALDDLLAEGVLTSQQISEIIWVQLAQPAQFKRLGDVGPVPLKKDNAEKERRVDAHSKQALVPLLDDIAERAGFGSRARAEEALLAVTEMIVQRITEEQAQVFLAQLPRRTAEHLSALAFGPDTSITADVFLSQISKNLGVSETRATEISRCVFEALQHGLTGNLLAHVSDQLPHDIRLFLNPFKS